VAEREHHPFVAVTRRLHASAAAHPGRVAYTFLREDGQAEDISCAELERRVLLLARALGARARPGERAVLLFAPGLAFVVAFFACLCAGVVAVPAAFSQRRRASDRLQALQALLADAAPALVLTASECAAAVAASLAPVVPCPPILCSDTLTGDADLPELHGAMTAFLQYTSGSTAQSKGVEVTHANLASNVESIRRAFGFGPRSVMVSWLPPFHDMGLVGSVIAPMALGFHSVLMAPAAFLKQPVRWLEAITRYRGTCAGAPDFAWDYCARRVGADEKALLDLSSLEVAYNGAEPVRASTLREFAAAFACCGLAPGALFPCYGMAEATLLVSGGPRGRGPRTLTLSKARLEGNQIRETPAGLDDAREVVSCGPPAHGVSLMTVDPDTCLPAAPHRIGEIWVAGPGVARRYWRRPEQSAQVLDARLADGAGPWLRTGDLGFLRDGELYVTGRLKDLVIVNGRNIYPQDVEQLVERTIDFIEPNMCAAFGLVVDGQERLAVVAEANRALVRTARQGQDDGVSLAQVEALAQRIRTAVAQQFGVAVALVAFVRPGAFPRTTSGKVQRARCKALAESGELDLVYAARPGGAMPAAARADNAAADDAASRARADALIGWLRQYAPRRINSRLMDERRSVAPHLILDLGNQGFFGLQAPAEHGGCALATTDLVRVLGQLAALDLTLATIVGVHNGLGLRPLLRFGAPALRQRLLPRLAAGRELAAYALTEPGAGSNPRAMRARAQRCPGGWRVSAEKHLIGLASWAGWITLLAKAVDEAGTALGAIALLVPEDAAGLVQGPEALTMGMRAMVQNTVLLDGVFVPDAQVLLAPGEGMRVARDAMGFSRLGIGALCVGAMKRCAQLMARYAARREIGTGNLLENPVTRARLHELACAIDATEALVQAIAAALDAQAPLPQEACLACKCAAAELLWEAADRLVQMLGGRGYLENNVAPQLLRDARVLRVLEGPTEALYAHLGATLAVPGNGAAVFIGQALGGSRLAAELAAIASAPRASDAGRDYRLGELCTWAMLLAAAERQAAQAGAQGRRGAAAAAWARARFHALAAALREPGAAPLPASELLERVAGFAADIGDLEQALPGEAQELDALLRLAPPQARAPAAPAPAPAPAATRELVHDIVLRWLRSDGGKSGETIGHATSFTELGMDSLASVPIALELEQQTGLSIAPELLYDYQSIDALADYIDSRRGLAQTDAGALADAVK
jgi:acyl-CoA synthetase (AMP-forming)/AMP-acid ligase II/alkylation response protein AidB-like acyl-CoA dehydrogenase/acyl carrier protein